MGIFPPNLYIDSLIDDFGIWQHSDETSILLDEGYALDDAARGLLLTLALGNDRQSESLFSYLQKSQTKTGFFGFATPDREFIDGIASDDATGQVVWAAGYAYYKNFSKDEAVKLIEHAVKYLLKTQNMRGFAYAVLGAVYIDKKLADVLYERLKSFFDDTDESWPWPEDKLTYGNGIIPYAFLRYGMVFDDKDAIKQGKQLLDFVEKKCTTKRLRGPVGNDGWLPRGSKPAPVYSQQPIDAAYMVWAWLAAYEISKNPDDLDKAKAWFDWFEGENVAGEKMYDPVDLRCFDGIDPSGVHHNSGAESNICLLLSKYMLAKNEII